MPCSRCDQSTFSQRRGGLRGSLRALGRATAAAAKARLREAGKLPAAADWPRRLAACRGCSLRVVVEGEPYCGRPIWQRVPHRPEAGCGCPLNDKARDPQQHCPLAAAENPAPAGGAAGGAAGCGCRWCAA